LLGVYRGVLLHVAADGVLTDGEQTDLRRLRDALGLTHDDARAAESVLEEVFRARLKEALDDDALSSDEERRLDAVAKGLGLPQEQVARIRAEELGSTASRVTARALASGTLSGADEAKLGTALREAKDRGPDLETMGQLYRSRLARALGDRSLSPEEKESLAGLAWNLSLPDELVQRIRRDDLSAVVKAVFEESIADRRLSPDEEREFERVCRDLGVTPDFDGATLASMQRFRLLWRIENGELPDVHVSLKLKRNETCHFVTPASHFEERTVTRRVRYSGPSARIRIAKGVYWRMGDVGVSKVTENVLAPLGSGSLYLTSSRLLFDGQSKTTSIALTKIINFQLYTDGVKIEKDSGKDQVFTTSPWDPELFGALLGSALERA
jgi:hypothetical protein